MTSDLWALVATIALVMVQLSASSILTLRQLGGAWVAGPRDELREATGLSGRVVRAHRNLLEIFPQFVAALFVVHAAGAVGSLAVDGAWLSSTSPPTSSVLSGPGPCVGWRRRSGLYSFSRTCSSDRAW